MFASLLCYKWPDVMKMLRQFNEHGRRSSTTRIGQTKGLWQDCMPSSNVLDRWKTIKKLPRWYRMASIFTRSEPLRLLPIGLFEEQSVADKSYEPSRTQNRHYNCCRHD
ncbi:hypothetical protein NPIL_339251 [Nephila pilipes]|uniref:Uncharacterized protein n=1 Tax=Nephila pilipes TaxID=299642 RepID=A0A8X6MC97_NEPPI|nr:hypothetical protein NPIL_339251 [Nephila pilipes]